MTQSGIELATFRFVVQCLNQVRHELAHVIKGTKSFMVSQNVATGGIRRKYRILVFNAKFCGCGRLLFHSL